LDWSVCRLVSARHLIPRRIKAWFRFKQDFAKFKALSEKAEPRFSLRWEDRYPCLSDRAASTPFDRHYIYHTAWAARILARTRPVHHVDISSSLYFCALVSAFVPIKFYDYRPADLHLDNMSCERADLLTLPFADGSIHSLSCMHVVEHVGLGRYGEPLDPNGDLKAIAQLRRVLAPGGSLFFVVPVGKPKIMFNAHRIYSYGQIAKAFSDLKIRQFALITDKPHDGLIENAPSQMADEQTYGCGCFWFERGL
jgi:SAM-dependent methyltransferase